MWDCFCIEGTGAINCKIQSLDHGLIVIAFGDSFYILLFARSIHGVGSAGICIGGMAAIAERYQEDCERSRFMGMIMGGIATGVLIGYPLGSVMYDFVDQKAPLLLVAGLLVLDTVFLVMVLRPRLQPETQWSSNSLCDNLALIARLLCRDSTCFIVSDSRVRGPTRLVHGRAISVSTLPIAILEPCLPIWLMETISPPKWQLGKNIEDCLVQSF
ncbi:synaptic vesicular amine transporter [Caerostris extrusa]|uniref:Synaptic vesicular amine transporter n=1 Tax=Caerostris extrusa TaxID=172846 RepID=A0AAV4MA99_CAEEX|nr:synaptic vesicular amine transporter [Caerostris extrusa]